MHANAYDACTFYKASSPAVFGMTGRVRDDDDVIIKARVVRLVEMEGEGKRGETQVVRDRHRDSQQW